jgi:MFS family permease
VPKQEGQIDATTLDSFGCVVCVDSNGCGSRTRLAQLDPTMINVTILHLGNSFGGSVTEPQWVIDAYTIVFASLIPTAGVLGDRIGAITCSSAVSR